MRLGLFLGGACLFIPALLQIWYLWALGFFLFGLFVQFFSLPASALRLADAPDELRSRVSGSDFSEVGVANSMSATIQHMLIRARAVAGYPIIAIASNTVGGVPSRW
jgi:hypothetical protein